MVNRDLIVGILGTLILVTAMVGVFRYEAAQAAGTGFDVTFPSATATGPTATGTTAEGASSTETLSVEHTNVTKIEFVLEWTDDVGDADEFNLTITSPDGATRSAQASNGRVVVLFENLAVTPPDARLFANSESSARERAEQSYTTRAAQGEWSATIKLVHAGDQVTPVGSVVVQEDSGNDWSLSAELTRYEAKFGA